MTPTADPPQPTPDPAQLWQLALTELPLQMTRATFDSWLKDTRGLRFGEMDGALVVACANSQAIEWITHRLKRPIAQTLERLGYDGPVRFIVDPQRDGNEVLREVAQSEAARRPPLIDPKTDVERRIIVELREFDPLQRGFVQVPSYAIRFWQPYLGHRLFNLWLTLKSYAVPGGGDDWPSVASLARICANGNKQNLIGRPDREQPGWFELLYREKVLWYTREGKNYLFQVLNTLPLLTPHQLAKLPKASHRAHDDFITKSKLDLKAWRQLTLQDLIKQEGGGAPETTRVEAKEG